MVKSVGRTTRQTHRQTGGDGGGGEGRIIYVSKNRDIETKVDVDTVVVAMHMTTTHSLPWI